MPRASTGRLGCRKEGGSNNLSSLFIASQEILSSNLFNLGIETVTKDFKRMPKLQLQTCSTLSGQDSTLHTQTRTTALSSELQGNRNNNYSLQSYSSLRPALQPPELESTSSNLTTGRFRDRKSSTNPAFQTVGKTPPKSHLHLLAFFGKR